MSGSQLATWKEWTFSLIIGEVLFRHVAFDDIFIIFLKEISIKKQQLLGRFEEK